MPYSDLVLAATYDEERQRTMERRLERSRALHEQAERVLGASHDRLWMRLLDRIRPGHDLTPYPCRLPNGDQGRTAIRLLGGEWTAVCVPDPRRRVRAGQATVRS